MSLTIIAHIVYALPADIITLHVAGLVLFGALYRVFTGKHPITIVFPKVSP